MIGAPYKAFLAELARSVHKMANEQSISIFPLNNQLIIHAHIHAGTHSRSIVLRVYFLNGIEAMHAHALGWPCRFSFGCADALCPCFALATIALWAALCYVYNVFHRFDAFERWPERISPAHHTDFGCGRIRGDVYLMLNAHYMQRALHNFSFALLFAVAFLCVCSYSRAGQIARVPQLI